MWTSWSHDVKVSDRPELVRPCTVPCLGGARSHSRFLLVELRELKGPRRLRVMPAMGRRLGLPGATRSTIDLTRRKAGVRGRKLNIDRAQFGRLTRTAQRRLAAELFKLLRCRAAGNLKRRPDRPGSDRIDADALRRKLFRERLHVIHGRRFGLRIVIEIGGWIISLLGSRADNDRTWLQVRQRRLDDPERRIDVGLHRCVEMLTADIEDGGARLLPAGIADDDIQTAQTLDRLFHQLLAKRLVPEIAGDCQPNPTLGLDQINDLFGVGLLARKIVDRDVGAFPRVGNRRRATHARRAAARPLPESPPVISALRPASRPEPL